MMMMTDRGKDAMLATSFKLGGDVEVAAGPVGAGAKMTTADVIAFSRAKGVYGGLSLEGSVVATRDGLNAAYYGRELSPIDILERRDATNPGADGLRAALAKAAAD